MKRGHIQLNGTILVNEVDLAPKSTGRWRERRSASWYLRYDIDLPSEFVDRLWNTPNAFLKQHVLQDKPRCTVARVEEPFGQYVWKRHSWGGIGRTIRRSLSCSTARRSWLDGNLLREAGVPTPRPRAFLERRIGPFKTLSYLLTDYVPGTSLYRFMRTGTPEPGVVEDFARQVAAIWQRLNEIHVQHNDFQTENFLVDPRGTLWLIDLERMCRHQNARRASRKQISDLERLLHPRNWRSYPMAAELIRQEILHTSSGQQALASANGGDHPLARPLATENRPSQLVTVMIPCGSVDDAMVECLKSVQDMADEILLIDCGAGKDIQRVARRFRNCRVVSSHDRADTEVDEWAESQAKHPWILRLSPNEELSPELAREIQYVLASEPVEAAFEVLHTARLHGQWLQHGEYRGKRSLRLYRKQAVRYNMRNGRVEVIPANVQCRVGRIPFAVTYDLIPIADHGERTIPFSSVRAALATARSTTGDAGTASENVEPLQAVETQRRRAA